MKGYKAFNQDMTCRGYQYEVGKTYHIDGEIEICNRGFHFCHQPTKCFDYYDKDSRLCEVEALGEVMGDTDDKCVTNTIRIVRELVGVERNRAVHGDGYGYGYGDGYGYSDGYGNGYGYSDGYYYSDGYGNGDGYGYSDGYGYGYGDGYGSKINKVLIYKEV